MLFDESMLFRDLVHQGFHPVQPEHRLQSALREHECFTVPNPGLHVSRKYDVLYEYLRLWLPAKCKLPGNRGVHAWLRNPTFTLLRLYDVSVHDTSPVVLQFGTIDAV